MITLYWAPRSRAGRMFWLLEEIGQPYEISVVDFRSDPPVHPEGFADASPLRKVPAIRDGDTALADTAAIALYLADRYAPGRLAPAPDHPDRGPFLFWTFYSPSAMEPAMTEKFLQIPPNPASYPWGSFDRMMSAIEDRLEGRDWLVGDDFTVADYMVGGALGFISQFNMAKLSPRQQAYADRCAARPAAKAGAARDAEETARLG
ncbi:hypothetical protein ATO6_01530 [Oceanicola sp. 22II-s10i]|uniref:glutathione S-transferase family protein n=1 Tax=Oceanicola sp. 22II-s10i TaxID=1317116 RepID=UPI000B6486DB|nr:glutathione S-transferase [Oceanicola sp. 22II-s10i]OWU85638.1 hypothetical protein ATO6_01530 [Oceanicola sp. 22II-s10i]